MNFMYTSAVMKHFDEWNLVKQRIDIRDRVFFDKGEIWFASIGKNIGDEQDGKNYQFERPILIIRKFNSAIYIGIPLTTKKKISRYYHQFEHIPGSWLILSQIRLLDSKRLLRKIGRVDHEELELIKRKIRKII